MREVVTAGIGLLVCSMIVGCVWHNKLARWGLIALFAFGFMLRFAWFRYLFT